MMNFIIQKMTNGDSLGSPGDPLGALEVVNMQIQITRDKQIPLGKRGFLLMSARQSHLIFKYKDRGHLGSTERLPICI